MMIAKAVFVLGWISNAYSLLLISSPSIAFAWSITEGHLPRRGPIALATAGLPVTDGFQSIFSLYMATGGQIRVM